ncbi:MAG: hypothetical protein QW739_01530, partial [Candidatus Odinarchaeota archaeon]
LADFGSAVAVISENETEEQVDIFIRGSTTAKTLKITWKKQIITIEPDEVKEVDEEVLKDKDTQRLINYRLLERV